jgi:putative hydrolase of the HAD superfamily
MSGFKYVASYLSTKYNLDETLIFNRMNTILEEHGRGSVFDLLLKEFDLYSPVNLHLCVYLYRSHKPDIKIYNSVLHVLHCLRELNLQLGIITDGRASVQKNKVTALKLEDYFDIIIYTDKLGEENWKPSLIPYQVALELLNTKPGEAVYIGDDPYKDFSAPKALGMMTIQSKCGVLESYWADKGFKSTDADFIVDDLMSIIGIIEER